MGTRGFLSYVVNGETKTTYNHHDSYPSGLGIDVLGWLRKAHEGGARQLAAELRVVRDSRPTPEDIERLTPYADTGVSSGRLDEWYVLLRRTQGNPAAQLDAGVILDGQDFPRDSLFAEYGYVIDFDARALEVYEGFQKVPHDKGRFAALDPDPDTPGYYPVALMHSWSFDALPTDDEFIKTLEPEDAES